MSAAGGRRVPALAPASVEELMQGWLGAWSGRDPEAFADLCAANVHYEDPLTPEPLEGAKELGRHAQRLWTGIPDVRLEATGPALGDRTHVSAPIKLVGTHRERLGPLPPTGRFLVLHAVVYGELDRGRLRRVRTFFDLWSAAVQVGLLPAAGTVGERALFLLRGFGWRPPPSE